MEMFSDIGFRTLCDDDKDSKVGSTKSGSKQGTLRNGYHIIYCFTRSVDGEDRGTHWNEGCY